MTFSAGGHNTPVGDQKRLGQYFTGTRLARCLASLGQARRAESILDPMAGTGDMLVAASQVGARPARIGAIELVPETATACWKRCQDLASSVKVETGSAFDSRSWDALEGAWDLVITNPPYVRYQTGSSSSDGPVKVPSADEVRSGLIRVLDERPTLSDSEREVLVSAATSYSGLSDLAVPAWLLAASAVAENGVLAMVVPATWLSRNYAGTVVAVLRRFFEIEAVIEDADASWFESALVRTNLVVARRVPDKGTSFARGRHLVIRVREAAGSDQSIVGKAFPVREPDEAFAAWIKNAAHPASAPLTSGWSDELDLVAALYDVSGRQKSVLIAQNGKIPSILPTGSHCFRIPRGIREILSDQRLGPLANLKDLGWTVGQGLRTGANEFFYVDMLANGLFRSALAPENCLRIPREVVRPAIRRQTDLQRERRSADSIGSGVLDLNGWALVEDADSADWHLIDGDLAELVDVARCTTYRREGGSRTLPELSAVRTNVARGRCWYHLPSFTSRHEPDLFVARVNAGAPRSYLNGHCCGHERRIIDANFSTIWSDPEVTGGPSVFALMALLSSTWTSAMLESLGTVLGGGALKLEATHLRRLLLPKINSDEEACLGLLGREIGRQGVSADTVYEVDQLVGQIMGISHARMWSLRRFTSAMVESRAKGSGSGTRKALARI